MIKDVRLLVAVPAAVALLSLIWFLRKRTGDKKGDKGNGTQGDARKSPQPVKVRDTLEKPVPDRLLHHEDQGITLTQRKIPEALDHEQSDSCRRSSHTSNTPEPGSSVSSSTPSESVTMTSTEASITSSRKVNVDEILLSAFGTGLREAQSNTDSDLDNDPTNKPSTGAPEVIENSVLVQERMVASASASVSQASLPSTPNFHSDEFNQNDNCSQMPSIGGSISLLPSLMDTQDKEGENQSGDSERNNSITLDSSSSTLLMNSSLSTHSWLHGDQNSLSCDYDQGQDVSIPMDLHSSRSGQRESSSDSVISSSTSLRNSFSDEIKGLNSETSWVEVESHQNTDMSNISSVPDSAVEETMEKSSVMAIAQLSVGANQQPDEPSANSISPVCDNNSVGSNDSGRGGSEQDSALQANESLIHFEFNMPSELCGRLIGRQGKNINFIKSRSGASVSLTNNPFTPEFQICQVIGSQAEVDEALSLIRRKFPLQSNPRLSMAPLNLPAASQIEPQPVIVPEGVQLSLPEGVSVDVYVSSIANAGHIFVQQPTHRTFMSLEKLNFFLNSVYGQDPTIPSVPEPAECGVICVCENGGSWYRTMITSPGEENGECQIKFVDYGGYGHSPISSLKQIRADFMSLPFQAVECFMANISPLSGENFFNDLATLTLGERTQLKLLKCQVVARSEDGTPFIHLYDIDHEANAAVMLNRSMAEDSLVRWVEIV